VEKDARINRYRAVFPNDGVLLPFSCFGGMMEDHWHWHRDRKSRRNKVVAFLLILIALFSGILIGNHFSQKTLVIYNQTVRTPVPPGVQMKPVVYESLAGKHSSFAEILIPAVDKDGNGITTTMFVQAFPGSGRVLTNIDKLLFWVDTQNSIRRATQVAENVTEINLSAYDIVYTIQANATVIGGPSAGAAIAIATIAALQNKSVNNSVMITGSVNHDGSVGPVGGIIEKAYASKDAGAQIYLVPMTQSTEVTYKTREYCEKIGWVDFCTTETYPVKVDIEKDAGIKVMEVMDILDAMEYMVF
jgi:hypothetical protein